MVPKHLTMNAASWISSTWIACSIMGPEAIGFIFDAWGASGSYAVIAGCFMLSFLLTLGILPKPQLPLERQEPMLKGIATGWQFVFSHQPLWGAMILLPVYANEILHVGAKGLGLLNAAPSLGALLMTLAATKHPPIGRAGRNLFAAVAGFGISILFFAFSRNFWLSMTALFFSGVFDGIIAANWGFICASNELGAFESGMVAAWIGTVPCVVVGGLVTRGVVALTAVLAPELRRLRFDAHTLERKI